MRTVIVLSLFLLAGCGLLSPETQQTALQAVDQMLAAGTITAAQADALRQSILAGSAGAWWQDLASALAGAALGYCGVQIRRGPVATPVERDFRRHASRATIPPPRSRRQSRR